MNPGPLKLIGVAALFALCGAWSAGLFVYRGPGVLLPGIPFALLCALLMTRHSSAIVIVPVIACLWPAAYYAAFFSTVVFGPDLGPYLSPGLGGLIGRWGVAVAVGIYRREILSTGRLWGAAAIGCVAGVSFAPWAAGYLDRMNRPADSAQTDGLAAGFLTWQAAVGMYVYALCLWSAQSRATVAERSSAAPGPPRPA